MNYQERKRLAQLAVKRGNWIIRADNNGRSHDGAFAWAKPGEWTEAPDWDPAPECGHGLHGQDREHGGYSRGTRLVFCDTEGEHVALYDKVKVRRARILLVDELPEGLTAEVLNLHRCTGLTALPEYMAVDLLYLNCCTGLTALPAGLTVKSLYLYECTGLTALPAGLTKSCNVYGIPKHLKETA